MRNPSFTVIMPLYNHEPFVGDAIRSVLGQSFGDFELIICNDGSTDDSFDVASSFKDERIKLINKPNGGTVSALNACLLKSSGHYICWLSSDDLYAPDKLRSHQRWHAELPDCQISIAPFGYLHDDRPIADVQVRVPEAARLLQFVEGNYINGLSVCAHRRLYGLHGLFDQRYRFAHDVERWFRFFTHHVPHFGEGVPLSFSRMNSSVTPDADLLGSLDVLKLLCTQLEAKGLRGFLPESSARGPLTLATAAAICECLFRQGNMFSRFDMLQHVGQCVAISLRLEGLDGQLSELMAATTASSGGAGKQQILSHLDDVASRLHTDRSVADTSFCEELLRLKKIAASPEQRQIVDRYLRIGL